MLSFKTYLDEKFRLTIKYHSKLNAKLWKRSRLDPKVAEFLKSKAFEFAKYSGVSKDRITDMIVTGSNANYNYTKYSDIDVHILCNEHGLDDMAIYLKKVTWTQDHPDLKIGTYPIEFYCQSLEDLPPSDQGQYSLFKNSWNNVPVHLNTIDVLDDPSVIDKVKFNIKYIKHLIKKGTNEDILEYKERLHNMRQAGLDREGEFSVENVLYKDLRNRGLIDQLNAKLRQE